MRARFKRFLKHDYKDRQFWTNTMGKTVFKIFRILFFFGLSYLFLFPLLYMFSAAFQSPESLSDPGVIWIPKSFSLDAMKAVIDLLHYWKSLLLTTEITVFSTLCSLVSCSMIGYGLARYRFKERGLVFALVVLTIVIPPQAVATSSFLNFRFFEQTLESLIGTKVSILNTPLTFILPSVFGCGLRAGLFIFIFRQFFKGIPKELEEASRIDGCGAFKTYMRIMVPMAKPAFITVCLYSVVWHWNDLYTSTMYFTSEIRPITPSLADLRDIMSTSGVLNNIGSELVVRSYFAAGAFLAAVPLLILFIVMQRHFTESIDNVGIVG